MRVSFLSHTPSRKPSCLDTLRICGTCELSSHGCAAVWSCNAAQIFSHTWVVTSCTICDDSTPLSTNMCAEMPPGHAISDGKDSSSKEERRPSIFSEALSLSGIN